jgi:hypothetical protein
MGIGRTTVFFSTLVFGIARRNRQRYTIGIDTGFDTGMASEFGTGAGRWRLPAVRNMLSIHFFKIPPPRMIGRNVWIRSLAEKGMAGRRALAIVQYVAAIRRSSDNPIVKKGLLKSKSTFPYGYAIIGVWAEEAGADETMDAMDATRARTVRFM